MHDLGDSTLRRQFLNCHSENSIRIFVETNKLRFGKLNGTVKDLKQSKQLWKEEQRGSLCEQDPNTAADFALLCCKSSIIS